MTKAMNLQNHGLGQEDEKRLRTEKWGPRRISTQGPGPYELCMVIDGAFAWRAWGLGVLRAAGEMFLVPSSPGPHSLAPAWFP